MAPNAARPYGRALVRVGCSGWQYRDWRGVFYPARLPMSRWLEHYASVFDTVEVNNTFYRLPEPETFARWHERVPPGFLYAIKASRFLTHIRRLREASEPVERLLSHAVPLGDRLGPILYQLPPRWPMNAERLETFLRFLDTLPTAHQHAIEFRDPSWYDEAVFEAVNRPHLTVCLHDMLGSELGPRRVGGFSYVRFHGATFKYGGRYGRARLAPWAALVADTVRERRPAYVYFNNDIGAAAPYDAAALLELIA